MANLVLMREKLTGTDSPVCKETLSLVQSTIAASTKQALMESFPGYCVETSAFVSRIQEASLLVGGEGISLTDVQDAHALNKVVSRMYATPLASRPHFSPLYPCHPLALSSAAGDFDGIYPAVAAGGMYPAVAAGGIYPAVAAGEVYPAGAAGGMYPADAAGGMYPAEAAGGMYPEEDSAHYLPSSCFWTCTLPI
jgi:hypothetical protein